MGTNAFTFENGKNQIEKDPDDIRYYGVDIVDALTAAGVPTAAIATDAEAAALGLPALSATPAGVTLKSGPLGPFFAQDTAVLALVQGGDSSGLAGNYVRFRIPLTTGEQIDRTIYFAITEH